MIRGFVRLMALLGVLVWQVHDVRPAHSEARLSASGPVFMGAVEIEMDELLPLPAWESVLIKLAAEEQAVLLCRDEGRCDSRNVKSLAEFVTKLAKSTRAAKIQAVNEYFNAWPYTTDQDQFGRPDLWQSPLGFMRRSGDCEDYAIAKYFTLRLLGLRDKDMRIVVSYDRGKQEAHAVLAVRHNGRFYLLDNRSQEIRQQSRTPDLVPKYAVNAKSRWLFVPGTEIRNQRPAASR